MMILCSNTAQALNIEVVYAEPGDPFGAVSLTIVALGGIPVLFGSSTYTSALGDVIPGTDDIGNAKVEFEKAVSLVESMIDDDITVRISVGWDSSCTVAAQTSTAQTHLPYNGFDSSQAVLLGFDPDEDDLSQGWRALVVNDAAAENGNQPIVSKLPETVSSATLDSGPFVWWAQNGSLLGPFFNFWGADSNEVITVTSAELKALLTKESVARFEQPDPDLSAAVGFDINILQNPESPEFTNRVDGSIRFCSDKGFPWDTDNSDGLDAEKIGFFPVAIHELIHSLGFLSGINGPISGLAFVTGMDMYTFSDETVKGVNLGQVFSDSNTSRAWLSDDERLMMYLGEQMIVPQESGNVFGAAHWQNLIGTPAVGIMDSQLELGFPQDDIAVKRTDLAVLDAIGYDINTDFVNASPPLMSEEILRELLGKPHGLGPVIEMGPPVMPFSSGIFIFGDSCKPPFCVPCNRGGNSKINRLCGDHPNLFNITEDGL